MVSTASQHTQQMVSVIENGQPRSMTIEAVKERFIALAREVMAADADEATAKGRHLRKQVAFGAFMIQVRPAVEGMFLRWLGEAKFGHFQKVYAAIALAEKYATADGLLDEAALAAAIDRYNAGAAELGYKTIDRESQSVRAAQIAGGMRSGVRENPQFKVSGAPENRNGKMTVHPHIKVSGAPETSYIDPDEFDSAEFGDVDLEAKESAAYLATLSDEMFREVWNGPEGKSEAVLARARSLGLVGGVGAGGWGVGGGDRTDGTDRADGTNGTDGTDAADAAGLPRAHARGSLDSSPRTREQQATFDADYAVAARMREAAGMVEAGGVSGELRARLVAVLAEIEQTSGAGALG